MTAPRSTSAQGRWTTKIGLALAVALLTVVLTQEDILKLGIIKRLELASIDYRFAVRGPHPTIGDSGSVVIVEISDESFKSLHERWPWPRSYYAHLLRNLKAAGARAVGIDLIFGGNDVYAQANDAALRAAIRETGLAVLAGKTEVVSELYSRTTSTENYGNIFFDVDSCLGLVNIRNDDDGVYRRYSPFFVTSRGDAVPTFGFAILNKYLDLPSLTSAEDLHDTFLYAGRSIPKYDPGSLLINFYGPSGTFRHIKFVDVIDDDSLTTVEEEQTGETTNTFTDPDYGYLYDGTFKNKIVLVGSTVPEEHDLFPVSIARGKQAGDNLMYGVEIHANVIENVLRNDFLRRQSTLSEILGVFVFTILTFVVTSALRGSKTTHHLLIELNGFLFTFVEVFLIGFAAVILFNKYNYVVTVISPMVAVLAGYVASTAYHFVSERKQRMLIKSMFSTYLDPVVVEELIRDPEKLALGGERKELTVLFSDIEGFTTISEGMSPEQLVAVLNEYLSAMSEIVFKNHGTLDKYEGDSVMAFWGAPIPQEDHALRACTSALQMQDLLTSIRMDWAQQQKPTINIRVGINTGDMVVGNMGGAGKFNYTVIGDSVNLASRLEGANKLYRTGIMVSEQTYKLVTEKILGRELDLLTVSGRTEPITTYELIQTMDTQVEPTLERFLSIYADGLQLYRTRRWKEARKKFQDALMIRPMDYPSQMYLERIAAFEVNPPPAEWNGVFVLMTK
jgi:adenylate cyclase